MELVTSPSNKYLKTYRSLARRRERRELNLLPLEGYSLVKEAARFGIEFEAVLLREGESEQNFSCLQLLDSRVPILHLEASLFNQTMHTELSQGIVAMVRRPLYRLEDLFAGKSALLLIVDRVQDPFYLGNMIRSAAASGASGVALLPGTVDATNPKSLNATKGAFFRFPIVETMFDALHEAIRAHDLALLALSDANGYPYIRVNWRRPVAVVVGNEGTGVTPEVQADCDASVSIPMAAGVESLNNVVSMSVIFFEAARQRQYP